ncbi:MAG: DNA-directed RNA polymerase subunit beta, partial [Flavobacteriales bacterium]|nr:DNA-directed RNA polymerase subunit beta [Flavobacteriales bacterium]
TPEGPNIGLIASLSSYARVDEHGFIETPYRKSIKGIVQNKVLYYSALEEENEIISQANVSLDKNNKFIKKLIQVRKNSETTMINPKNATLIDVSPNQMVSVAAGLIPFLEHDDANRALMGSNMQRQAVPLLISKSPVVGTGME